MYRVSNMKKNFNTNIKAIDGTDMVITDQSGNIIEKTTSLSKIILNALQGQLQGDDRLSGEERCKLIDLALRIYKATDIIDITLEEARVIKDRVGKLPGLNHVVYYRLNELLES